MEVTVSVPDDIAEQVGDAANLPRQLLEAFALENYRLERLTRHQVGQLLGLDYWQTDEFLARHKAKQPYTLADYELDQASLAKLQEKRSER